jgi:hypothetical protein
LKGAQIEPKVGYYGNLSIRVLFHVGPHKTGTTTLQFAFNALRQELGGHGILYPKGLHESGAHHVLAWQILQRPLDLLGFKDAPAEVPSQKIIRWLNEASSARCETLLWSAEDFSSWSVEQWKSVVKDLREHGVSSIGMIKVFRSPTSIARSAYGTLVMFGENRTFDELSGVLERRFREVLVRLEDVGGPRGILDEQITLDFKSLVTGGKLVERFLLQSLNVEFPDREWPALNVGLPHDLVEATRVWNTQNCQGVTVQDDTGDFEPEYFAKDPVAHYHRANFVAGLRRVL